MKIKLLPLFSILIASLFVLSSCTKETAPSVLKRDTDAVSIGYKKGAKGKISIRYNGGWSASSSASWLSLSPESGQGNDQDYEEITLTAERNTGEARSCTVTITPESGEPVKVEVTQAEGVFSTQSPSIKGVIKKDNPSESYIALPYFKALGGETVKIEVSLSGSSEGLSVESPYNSVIAEEGDGEISLPIIGTPTSLGGIIADVKITINDKEVFNGKLEASVSSDKTVFTFSFDKLIWGGDYLADKGGTTANADNTQVKADYDYSSDPTFTAVKGTLTAGTDGTVDMFKSMVEAYRIARGISDWDGSAVYERPGYIKLGTKQKSGWIMTPALKDLSAPSDITFSFDACRWQGETMTYNIKAEKAGTVIGGTIDAGKLPAPKSAAERKWTTITVTVKNATNETRLKIEAENLGSGGGRLFLDNFVVSGGAELRKEPLPAIEAASIEVQEAATSLTFSWPAIEDATGYLLTLAEAANPEFKKTVTTENVNYTFTSLPSKTAFIFTIKALYDLNNELDSEVTTKNASTGKEIIVLKAPTLSVFETPSYAYGIINIGDYSENENTTNFHLVLEKAGSIVKEYSFTFSDANKTKYAKNGLRFLFSGLEANTAYTAKVKREATDAGNYKDSEYGTVAFTTAQLPDKSGYMLWQDFDLHPWGGNGPALAFGIFPKDDNKNFNVITGVSAQGWSLATPVKNMNSLCNGVAVNVEGGQAHYHNTYMAGWDSAELNANSLTKSVYLCGGMMKFGTGSANGKLTLPVFDAENITVTFDAAPYMEPNKDNGLLENAPAVTNGLTFKVGITGPGSLTGDGTAATGGKVTLTNKSATDLHADNLGHLPYTPHTLKITGMNNTTRIYIETNSKTDGRMWLDNIKVKQD